MHRDYFETRIARQRRFEYIGATNGEAFVNEIKTTVIINKIRIVWDMITGRDAYWQIISLYIHQQK